MPSDSPFFPAFDTCPACQVEGLQPTPAGGEVNFACTACGACWHLELGWVQRVDPATCPGCRERGVCVAETVVDLREDEPQSADA